MKLVFQMGNEMLIVKIKGKEIYFSNTSLSFDKFIPLEPFIKRAHGEEKLKEFKEFIDKNVSEEGMKDYIIKEFESQGFIFRKEVK